MNIVHCLLAGAILLGVAWSAPAEPYTLDITDKGHAVVTLSDGLVIFADACPFIRSSSNKDVAVVFPKARPQQENVTDALGTGVRTTLTARGIVWQITTYSDKPFLTAQVTYENTGRKAETLRMLSPWSATGSCSLGEGTNLAPVLDNGQTTNPQAQLRTSEDTEIASLWNLAAYNPANGHSLVAGFLTNKRPFTQINIERSMDPDDAAFASFQAECRYSPAITLAPGEKLTSEVLYLAIAESSPQEGLERFAASVADCNNLRPTRRALPHGWDSWVSHHYKDITEQNMLKELDVLHRELFRYGWTHFSLDDGWENGTGDWTTDPDKFPKGMKAFADAVHDRGMTAGIWTEPFTVDLETALAKQHPDWLAEPNFIGRSMLGNNERILDITADGAYDHVKEVYRKIIEDWGYDALVETDFVYHLLLAKSYAKPNTTNAEALRMGMNAIREGAGDDTFIMGVSPFSITGYVADGMRTGVDCAPVWRSTEDIWAWGCVDTLTNAARRYYFAPRVFALDQDCVFFGHEETRKRWNVENFPRLTREQQLAWMTGAALTGGAVKLGDAFSLLTPEEFSILRRLLPVWETPARPVDLFEQKESRVWVLPIDCAIGQWHIVAVFNWDESAAATIPLDFAKMGLDQKTDYAVFDFWPGDYCGVMKEKTDLIVPAGSVRLLSMRPLQNRPMFLSTDSHILQGAIGFTALDWVETTRTLQGTFTGVKDTDYVLSILAPEGHTPVKTEVSAKDMKTEKKGEVVRLIFHCDAAGPVSWTIEF